MKVGQTAINTFSQWKVAPYLFYLLFLLLFWLFHIVIISAISSIHFLLGHDLSVTENWIFAHAWPIVSICSGVAFFLLYRLLKVVDYDDPIRWIFQYGSWGHYKRRSLVAILYFYFVMFYLGKSLTLQTVGISFVEQLLNAVGAIILISIYFLSQLILIHRYYEKINMEKVLFLFITWVGFSLFFEMTVLYKVHTVLPYYAFLFLLSGALLGAHYFWNIGSYFLIFCVTPVVLFFGFDPIYSTDFSFAHFKSHLNISYLALSLLFMLLYIYSDQWMPSRKSGN